MKLARLVAAIGIAGMLGGMGQAQANLDEGFDGAIPPPGWATINNSTPIGITDWFQGNTGVFDAQSGAADSYIAANFLAAANGG
ncbi:MAG: choice-of-anchor J domain-containing protein, partial [Betaproteobacteria bacterium]